VALLAHCRRSLTSGILEDDTDVPASVRPPPPAPRERKHRNFFLKFFEPQKYATFHSSLRLLSQTHLGETVPSIEDNKHESAYQHPSLTSNVPTLWIARDELGTSKKLMEEVGKDIKVSDEGAWINDKGKLEIDKENLRSVPIWKEHICY